MIAKPEHLVNTPCGGEPTNPDPAPLDPFYGARNL
ncbi:hypothetical protein CGMCC3_g7244 [Colletotrichum fructicola]|uniref:Uncharacterized protein n=1 Tax=Colletotrichum kahawae TaxID=34407 RepID=A0AAE0CZT8_COLKA|nr:uncharacterized protein CGMCC3_g7244 [Colletotrichum fructicola]KAE9576726.1 hypothetical protein CGMCC3_g7244 [Colletotrichum fructicola]KAK2732224.1 hypothetical protein CKAH01_02170 [Colletotrichum kahawae]